MIYDDLAKIINSAVFHRNPGYNTNKEYQTFSVIKKNFLFCLAFAFIVI